MDFAIGRVVDFLKATGQYEDTVIIFTSDVGSVTFDKQTASTRTITAFVQAHNCDDYSIPYCRTVEQLSLARQIDRCEVRRTLFGRVAQRRPPLFMRPNTLR